MTSFRVSISPRRQAAGDFIVQVRRALQKALVEERQASGMTLSEVAQALGVQPWVISRDLRGGRDLTLGRVAALAWAMGRDVTFELVKPEAGAGAPADPAGADPAGADPAGAKHSAAPPAGRGPQ